MIKILKNCKKNSYFYMATILNIVLVFIYTTLISNLNGIHGVFKTFKFLLRYPLLYIPSLIVGILAWIVWLYLLVSLVVTLPIIQKSIDKFDMQKYHYTEIYDENEKGINWFKVFIVFTMFVSNIVFLTNLCTITFLSVIIYLIIRHFINKKRHLK